MIYIEGSIYVRIVQLEGERAPVPRPLSSGFNEHTAYRILGMSNPSESADAFAILSNDRDEIWFICTRHLRTCFVKPSTMSFRMPLDAETRIAEEAFHP